MYNRLILAYRTENKLVLIVLMFSLGVTPSSTFTNFCAVKILFFVATSFGVFFLALLIAFALAFAFRLYKTSYQLTRYEQMRCCHTPGKIRKWFSDIFRGYGNVTLS